MIIIALIDSASLQTFVLDVEEDNIKTDGEFDEELIAKAFKEYFELEHLKPSEFSWGVTEKINISFSIGLEQTIH
jgi:hypothetical protein